MSNSLKDKALNLLTKKKFQLVIGGHFIPSADYFIERSKYQPIRLTYEQRKLMRLVSQVLSISDYTAIIDQAQYINVNKNGKKVNNNPKIRNKHMYNKIKQICSLLSGLAIGSNYEIGKEILEDNDFSFNAKYFQYILQLTIRHKIRNPEKLKNEYVKLLYIMQDACGNNQIKDLLNFY